MVLWLRDKYPELTASQIGLRVGLATQTVQRADHGRHGAKERAEQK